MSSNRPRRLTLRAWGLIGLGVLIALGMVGWLVSSWLGTYRQAQAVQGDVTGLRAYAEARDWQRVQDTLPDLVRSSADLHAATGAIPWRLLSIIPIVGPTASAVDALAQSLSEVSVAAEPLAAYAERIASGKVRGPDGSLAVDDMEQVAPLLRDLTAVLEASDSRLGRVDSGAVQSDVAQAVTQFRTTAVEALPTIHAAGDIATWLPGMLGSSGERSWLVLLQNPAEARGTGGFLGGFTVLNADAGRLSMADSGTSRDLNRTPIPLDNAPADSRLLWGGLLTAWNTLNLSPHFPLTAQLSVDGMKAKGTAVDGVVAIDPAAVSAMLSVTGPVEAEGITLDAGNVEQFFAVDIYRDYPGSSERDAVTVKLMTAVFEAFLTRDWDPLALVEASREAVATGSMRAWSSVPGEQEWLAELPIGGVISEGAGPAVAVAFNNAAGNKMDAFVSAEVDYSPGRCLTRPVQESELTIRLRNDAPEGLPDLNYGRLDDPAAREGSTSMLVHVYAPHDANYLSATLNGETYPMNVGSERGRPVWWTKVVLDRGQDAIVDIQFEEPAVLDVEPAVLKQAMVIDEIVYIGPGTGCERV